MQVLLMTATSAIPTTLPLFHRLRGDIELPELKLHRLRGGDIELVQMYIGLCHLYESTPHPSILAALRWDLHHLHPVKANGQFRDHDLLPLCDLLLLPQAAHITSISFRNCRLRASAGVQIARLIARMPQLETLDVSGNVLGSDAGAHIADALAHSHRLRELKLRSCRLRAAGTDALSLALALPSHEGTSALRSVDLTNNQIGFRAKVALERVNMRRMRPLAIELGGNLVLTEALNVFTHGAGAMLALAGSFTLMRAVRHASNGLYYGCLVYCASLLACYLSSTCFHSMFPLQHSAVRHALHIADQCAIYLLIAGSYTPFMLALFGTSRRGVSVLVYIWTLATIGVVIEIGFHQRRGVEVWIKFASLFLYVAMGWSAAWPPLLRAMRAAMEPDAFRLLIGGGLTYSLGVPVFIRNRGLDHAIWHLFVLGGSAIGQNALCGALYLTVKP